MSAHTPGPWGTKTNPHLPHQSFVTDVLDGYVCPTSVRHEDARLIAAAPDLLAACQEVMRNFAAFAAEHNIKGESLGVTACRAAIAKAEAA